MGLILSKAASARFGGDRFLQAITNGDDSLVKTMLEEEPRLAVFSLVLHNGQTALHIAAASGRLDYLQLLHATAHGCYSKIKPGKAERGVQALLNSKNSGGQTPLMLACKFGKADCVAWLLDNGADPTLFDSIHQRTCLHYCALYGQTDCIAQLFRESVVVAGPQGVLPLAEVLLLDSQGRHKYVDVRAAEGFAALHMAASQGHTDIVAALLERGAALDVRCYGTLRAEFAVPARWKADSTPLHIAAARGSLPMCRAMLYAYQQRVRAAPGSLEDIRLLRDHSNMRPVDVAHSHGYARLTQLLSPHAPLEWLAYRLRGRRREEALGPKRLSVYASMALRVWLTAALQQEELAPPPPAAARLQRLSMRQRSSPPRNSPLRTSRSRSASPPDASPPLAPPSAGPMQAQPCEAGPSSSEAQPAPLSAFAACAAPFSPEADDVDDEDDEGSSEGSDIDEGPHLPGVAEDAPTYTGSSRVLSAALAVGPEAGADIGSWEGGLMPLRMRRLDSTGPSDSSSFKANQLALGKESGMLAVMEAPEGSTRGVRYYLRRQRSNISRSSVAQSESGEECGICFDAANQVFVAGCGHRCCRSCALKLCATGVEKAPRCPFCRGFIGGFQAVPPVLAVSPRSFAAIADAAAAAIAAPFSAIARTASSGCATPPEAAAALSSSNPDSGETSPTSRSAEAGEEAAGQVVPQQRPPPRALPQVQRGNAVQETEAQKPPVLPVEAGKGAVAPGPLSNAAAWVQSTADPEAEAV